jgi:hypothetical protein
MNACAPAPPSYSSLPAFMAGLNRGLALLLEALEYAQEVGRDRWEFALELSCLAQAGVTLSALRWLLHKSYLEHAIEQTQPGAAQRTFRPINNLTMPPGCCFVLTESGLHLARRFEEQGHAVPDPGERKSDPALPVAGATPGRPQWRVDHRELWCGPLLVKEFRRPAPHQELVLAAFEEEGWPSQIDDPLPGVMDVDPKRRLHDAIIRLNRHQRNRVLVFRGDGSGKAIRWGMVAHRRVSDAPDAHQIGA